MSTRKSNGRPQALTVTIIFNPENGQLNMQRPQDPLLTFDILLEAQKALLHEMVKTRAEAMAHKIEVAPAAALKLLPPE